MKLTLFIIALLSVASFVSAETFLNAKQRKNLSPHLSAEAFVKNLKKSQFGNTVLNLASLQFKTSGKLSEVIDLLNGLSTKLQGQQADEDQAYAFKSAGYTQTINDQTDIIDSSNANIQSYTQERANDQNELSQYQIDQALLQQQQAGINAAIQSATQIRAKDAADFADRTSNSEVIIKGLQATLNIFQGALQNQEVDQDAANHIISLLNQLVSAFQVSIAQDTQQEDQAIQDYNDQIADWNSQLEEIASNLATIAIEIQTLTDAIDSLTKAIDGLVITRDNAQVLKDGAIQAQADLDSRYNDNKAVRAQQVQLLATAVSTLQNNADNVQSYLNQA